MRFLVVDVDHSMRVGIERWILSRDSGDIVLLASDLAAAAPFVDHRLACAIIEAHLDPCDLRSHDGVGFALDLRAKFSMCAVNIVTSQRLDARVQGTLFDAGVAWWQKPIGPAELLPRAHLRRMPANVLAREESKHGLLCVWTDRYDLSGAETQNLDLAVEGADRETIALRRRVSRQTVGRQVKDFLKKTLDDSLVDAANRFLRELNELLVQGRHT